jgi:hypothetical protein
LSAAGGGVWDPRMLHALSSFLLALTASVTGALPAPPASVERWGTFELALAGPRDGNPFTDVELSAELSSGNRRRTARGFYDGDGTYRVRFMPDAEGVWRYVTRSNRAELSGKQGTFRVTAARAGNHGPVRVSDRFHFAYADGTPHASFGTTIYALVHQDEALQQRTMASLRKAPFNKVRLTVLPKWYDHNRLEPPLYPFERASTSELKFDTSRPNPMFFRLLDRRIAELGAAGIEADVILFHPYDGGHWGFDRMGRDADERYLRYVLARLGAFRNVWWSMANEWDFVRNRSVEEWNHLFDVIAADDPYGHLTSIHNGGKMFDHARAPITHVSVQNADLAQMQSWRDKWGKPVIDDECQYEGDIDHAWGNITGEELVHRFWLGMIGGGYVGHGETFRAADDVLWWSRGGELKGQSPARIAFLRRLVEGGGSLEPLPRSWPFDEEPAARQGDSYLVYFSRHRPGHITRGLLDALAGKDATLKAARWKLEVIDPWAMTVTPIPGEHGGGDVDVALPGRPYLAVRATPLIAKTPPRPKTASAAP